jgi:hypothetical protein
MNFELYKIELRTIPWGVVLVGITASVREGHSPTATYVGMEIISVVAAYNEKATTPATKIREVFPFKPQVILINKMRICLPLWKVEEPRSEV